MFNDTVTVFNHYKDDLKKDRWNRTVLNGNCMWKEETVKTVSNNQVQIANFISLKVLYRKGYLPPVDYAKLDNMEKQYYFTFNPNNNLDVIVLGHVEEELNDSYTLTDLPKNYPSVATISAVSDNTRYGALKHWKISAK